MQDVVSNEAGGISGGRVIWSLLRQTDVFELA